jgi:hypothetical protein
MPAKKKPARRNATRRAVCGMCEQLAADVQRLLAERDAARKELAEARHGREAWCHKAVECEEAKERAEQALRDVLAGIVSPRPSVPTPGVNCVGLTASEQPATTLGLPGDMPDPRRFSREFRG